MPTQVVGRRVGAFIIDAILFWAVEAAIFFALAGDPDKALRNGDVAPSDTVYGNVTIGDRTYSVYGSKAGLFFLVIFVLWLGYYIIWPGLKGVTAGKLAMGIKIVKDDGSGRPPGIGRAIARYFLLIADAFPYFIPMLTGFIVALNSKQNKRIGDMVAGTIVVDKNAAVSPAAAPPPPPGIPFQQS